MINNDLDVAAANLESIIVAESSRTQRLREGGGSAPLYGRRLMGKSPDEWVDLVDEQNHIVGKATRSEVRQKNLPHRGIAVLVCNAQGQVYVHQRTAHKDLFPSMFDMFVGGVVGLGESYEDAARREAAEELGVGAADFTFLFDHLYKSDKNYSWIRAYRVVWDGPVEHQLSEIAWGQWMDEALLEEWTRQVEIVPDGLEVFQHYLNT